MRSGATRHAITLLAALLGAACTTTTRDLPQAGRIGLEEGYREHHLGRRPGQEPALPGRYVILAFSGGGTRASALAQGVLREMEATPARDAPALSLLHAVDMVSSTSGGSVTAANFTLHGPEGYARLHAPGGFLGHDGMADLAGQIVLNPANALNFAFTPASRIEALPEMLRREVFGGATFRTLRDRAARRPPILLLNAADMRTGQRFTFTQEQLDRLCIDLRDLRLADAVAASAAFPVALTPLPLPVHSPCPAQIREREEDPAGIVAGFENRVRLREARAAAREGCDAQPHPARDVLFGESARDQPDLARALRQWRYLNRDACGRALAPRERLRYVHLLDGGTADNLALSAPLEAATGGEAGARLGRAIGSGAVEELVVIGVNARSQGAGPGRDAGTPGVVGMILAAIDTPLDSRSAGLTAELAALEDVLRRQYAARPGRPLGVRLIRVDFENIADAECREAFQGIATSWRLDAFEVDALQEVASAMLRADERYLALAAAARDPAAGRLRARSACDRLRNRGGPPLVFGAG